MRSRSDVSASESWTIGEKPLVPASSPALTAAEAAAARKVQEAFRGRYKQKTAASLITVKSPAG